MVKEYLSSWVVLGLTLGLYALNLWVTTRRAEPPWSESAKEWLQQRRARNVVSAIAVVTTFAVLGTLVLWLLDLASLPGSVLFGLSAGLVVVSGHSRVLTAALMVGLGAFFALDLVYPSALGIQLLWLVPLIPLAGFLPRLMVALGSRRGPANWLMNIWLWVGLLVASAVVDTAFHLDAIASFVAAWELRLSRGPTSLWFDTSSLSLLDATLYGNQKVSLGMFTPYALLGMLSAMALWARRLNQSELVYLPMIVLVAWLVFRNGQILVGWGNAMSPMAISTAVMLLTGVGMELFFSRDSVRIKDILLNRHPE